MQSYPQLSVRIRNRIVRLRDTILLEQLRIERKFHNDHVARLLKGQVTLFLWTLLFSIKVWDVASQAEVIPRYCIFAICD